MGLLTCGAAHTSGTAPLWGVVLCCRKFWGKICIFGRLFLLALSPWLLSLLLALCAEQGFSAAGTGQEGDKEGTEPMGFIGQSALPSVLPGSGVFLAKGKADRTAGLILLPQAGTRPKNNVTAGNRITPA